MGDQLLALAERLSNALNRWWDRVGLRTVCERVTLPEAGRCRRPAVAMVTDPHCEHDTYVCEDCLADTGKPVVWMCRVCDHITTSESEPIAFEVWEPRLASRH
jgi:hypothetical protein